MKNILFFTAMIMLISIIKVQEKENTDLKVQHDKCHKIKPITQKGKIAETINLR